jgi:hypothetical protein
LLRNRENVTGKAEQVRLSELLAANRALFTVYVLKDDLKELWDYATRATPVLIPSKGVAARELSGRPPTGDNRA